MTRKKFTPELERILLDPSARPMARATAVWCMQVDGEQRHEDLIVSFLDHSVPDLRLHALFILLRSGRYAYVPLALDWLAHDDDYEVRSQMALALANVAVGSPAHRETILRALVDVVAHDASSVVAACAYEDFLFVVTPHRRWEIDEDNLDRNKDVDQALLDRYRGRRSPTAN